MDMTISHLGNVVEIITPLASEDLEVGPHLPVDLSPGDSVSLSDKGHKLLEVPRSIHYMLSSNLSVIIDVGFSFRAMEHFPLAHGE